MIDSITLNTCSAKFNPHLLHYIYLEPYLYVIVILFMPLSQTIDFVRSANNLLRVIYYFILFIIYNLTD